VIEIDRHLLVAAHFLARNVGDHFFGCRLHDEVPVMPVLQAQEFGTILAPAPGLLPEFRWLHDRHQQFDRACPVHLVAHDRLDLAHHAQSQWHPGIDAGRKPPDHA